jgi:hypothetical protein
MLLTSCDILHVVISRKDSGTSVDSVQACGVILDLYQEVLARK